MKNTSNFSGIFVFVAITIAFVFTNCNGETTDITKQDLTGTVTLDNMSPNVGETIKATYNGGNGTGLKTWQWKSGDIIISNATIDSYTVTTADIGNILTAIVSFADQNGNLSASTNVVAIIKPEPKPNSFNKINDMATYLIGLDANTVDTPYEIILYDLDISSNFFSVSDPLGGLFNAFNGKYVSLDMSACTGTSIPNILYWNTPNLRNNRDRLVSIILPSNIKSIGDYAFLGCDGLTGELIIPDSVEKIGTSAFFNCSRLNSIILGNSLNSIDERFGFSNCTDLISINVSSGNSTYSSVDGVLYNKPITNLILCPGGKTSVEVPDTVTSINSEAFDRCGKLTEINVNSSNSTHSSVDGVLYNKSMSILIRCPEGKEGVLIIQNGVTSIWMDSFLRCSKLTSVTIPSTVIGIGSYAFSDCSGLTIITIPNSVTSIGDGAFARCTSLVSVTFLGFIGPGNFSTSAFDGNLHDKYLDLTNGLAGTYTRSNGTSTTWTKQ